jgi:hypothetical protein
MVGHDEPSHVVESIFQALLNASTEKELAEHLSSIKWAIALYEAKNASKH